MEEYFLYSYNDEVNDFIGVFKADTPAEILDEALNKYDEVELV